jgi:hypothetical protein
MKRGIISLCLAANSFLIDCLALGVVENLFPVLAMMVVDIGRENRQQLEVVNCSALLDFQSIMR